MQTRNVSKKIMFSRVISTQSLRRIFLQQPFYRKTPKIELFCEYNLTDLVVEFIFRQLLSNKKELDYINLSLFQKIGFKKC